MKEPEWVSKEMILALHNRQLAEHGGVAGIRDERLLEQTLARPKNLFLYSYMSDPMPRLAASYAYDLAIHRPFMEGNERTALMTSRTFLLMNSYDLTASQEGKYRIITGLASGTWDEEGVTAWFIGHARPV